MSDLKERIKKMDRVFCQEIDMKQLDTVLDSKAIFSTEDLNTSVFLLKLKLDDNYMDLEGCECYVNILKPDRKKVKQFCEVVTPTEGLIALHLNKQAIAVGGIYTYEITVVNTSLNKKTISPRIIYNVSQGFEDNGELTSVDSYDVLVSLIDKVKKIEAIEIERVNAESTRLQSEEQRVSNERIRETNEQNRTQAEATREEEFSTLKNDVQTKINELDSKFDKTTGEVTENITTLSELVKNAGEKETSLISKITSAESSTNILTQKIEEADAKAEEINLPKVKEDIQVLQNGLKSNQSLAYEGHDLKCENTFDGRTEDIVLEGMTYQNLFPSTFEGKIMLTNATFDNSNGTITFSPVKNSYCNSWEQDLPLYKPNTTYTIVIDILENTLVKTPGIPDSSAVIRVGRIESESVLGYGGFDIDVLNGVEGKHIKKVQTIDDFSKLRVNFGIRLFLMNAFDSGLLKFKLMILEGDYTQPNSYIPPYFGGIKSVGEKEKNLCEFLEPGGIIYAGGQDYPNDQYFRTSYIPVEKGKNYSVSPFTLPNLMKGFGIYYYSKNKEWIKNLNSSTNASYFTASATGYVRLEFKLEEGNHINTEQLSKIKIQVNEGKLLSYIPLNKNKISILSSGKNLFKGYDKPIKLQAGKSYYLNSSQTEGATRIILSNVKEGDITCTEMYWSRSGYYIVNSDRDTLSFSITCNKDVEVIFVKFGAKEYLNIQLEEGTQTPFVPYKQDKKEILLPFSDGLKGLPNGVKDIIYNKEDGCYVKQKIGKMVLNSGENWCLGMAEGGWQTNGNTIPLFFYKNSPNSNMLLCDKFINCSYFISNDLECVGNTQTFMGIRINKVKLETQDVEGFKKWLQTNPVTVYYELEEPIETKLSDKKINLDTYNLLTYIFSDNSISPNIKTKVTSNLGSIIQQNAKNINDIYRILDELIIPQITENATDIALLKV